MPNPKLVIYPEKYCMLEAGVRLQQLLLLHPYAVGWKTPHASTADYDWLIKAMWKQIRECGKFSSYFAALRSRPFCDLSTMWEYGVESGFRKSIWFDAGMSAVPPKLNEIVRLVEGAVPSTDSLFSWFQLGRCGANGHIEEGSWRWIDEVYFQQLLSQLGLSKKDLFPISNALSSSIRYPEQFRNWHMLELGLSHLAVIAAEVKQICSEPYLPTTQQAAILKALNGKTLKTDALGTAIGDRRSLFARKGGRDHLFELRARNFVAWHPTHGFYSTERPPSFLST